MPKFTEKQMTVINHNEGNIVVSASAGSGKTSVMVERLIRLISQGKASVKEILAVTFTRLAATQMREKISKALIGRIKEGKDIERLRKELNDLSMASISTIDSFLNSLIRKYFYLADVDPAFSIIAESEEKTLKNSALNEVLEDLYDNGDEDLTNLLRVFIKKRKDDTLKCIILKIYGFLESETDPDAFLDSALFNYSDEGLKKVDNRLIALFIEKIDYYYDKIFDLYNRSVNLGVKGYADVLTAYKNLIENLYSRRDAESLREFSLYKTVKPRLTKSDEFKAELYDDFALVYDGIKKIQAEIEKIFYADYETRLNDLLGPRCILQSLIKIIKLFREEYDRQKKEQSLLDYSDLSHIGYKILQNKEVIEDLHSAYKYIFVDEYQDTNGIQESIFKLLESDNLFLVGDVKQSIYGFRGCRSENFSRRVLDAETYGTHVELDSNFRSSQAVIDTVNEVFSKDMTESVMGFEYRKHPMIYGNLFGSYKGEAELFYLCDKDEKENLDLGVYSVEKHLSAEKSEKISYEKLVVYAVKNALNKMVYDKKEGVRLARYSDIAVLNRTVQSGVDRVVKELEKAGIPTVSENKRSIKTYPEIQLLINILQCILSPDDDISLAGALKSSVGGLTDADLKKIRDAYPTAEFHEAAIRYSQTGDRLADKLRDFYSYLARLRLISAFEGVPSLIRRMMREKSIDAKLSATPQGEYKLRRIDVFISHAYKGETERFIQEFMTDLDDALDDMTLPAGGGVDAVNVISMHASKGLEYPIVIVAGVDRNWNVMDAREEVFCARDVGIGVKVYERESKVSRSSVIKEYIGLVKQRENLKEELRLLYVALTRAESILYIVCKNSPKEEFTPTIDAKKQLDLFNGIQITKTPVSAEDLKKFSERDERRALILPEADSERVETIKKYVEFSYPYQRDTTLSLKRTVTEISKNDAVFELDASPYSKPMFSVSDADTGNAYHKFLELLDFEKIGDNGLIEELLSKLPKEWQQKTDVDRIKQILNLDIFKEIKNYKLYKEQPFIVTVPPNLAGEEGDEDVLLQGVIDLLCIKEDNAIIIDYKHSALSKKALKQRYHKQLDLYAYAVEKSLGKKVIKKVLVNLLRVEEITLD